MYIFQPDRYLLRIQIAKQSKYIKGRVLDLGAGTGDRYSSLFSIEEYIRMDTEMGQGVDIVGRAEDIPISDDHVDSVVCTQVFEHLSLPEQSALEIKRVLKKGGYLLLTAPQMNELHEEPNDFFRYTKYGLKTLFERSGFEMVFVEQRGGYYTMIAQIKIRYLIDKYDLYSRPILGRVFNRLFHIYGKLMMWRDSMDQSRANLKHTVGWCMVFRKK